MSSIFNQLPEALSFEVFMCQSSFGKRKLTSCSGFIFLKVLTASFGKNNIFLSLFGAFLALLIFLKLLAFFGFDPSGLFFLYPFTIMLHLFNIKEFYYKVDQPNFLTTHICEGGVLLLGLYLPNGEPCELAGVTEPQ